MPSANNEAMTTLPPVVEGEAGFDSFGLSAEILQGVQAAGFTQPSSIQSAAIPLILAGRDVIAQAQTGTGKTAAFGLPLMHQLTGDGSVEALVVVPTRELATQISDELHRLGRFANVKTVPIYGGQSYTRQFERLSAGAQIVVATPGRLLDLLRSKRIRKFTPRIVVLDEADEMLDMGFLEEIEDIFTYLPKERQTLLFSATVPPAIQKLAQRILKKPEQIKIASTTLSSGSVTQSYYVINEYERDDALVRLMDGLEPAKSIVFCRTQMETDRVADMLDAQGFQARSLHGAMDQRQRNAVIGDMKKGNLQVLVATDVAARGLDINDVTHVFNFHMPMNAESYVHRIGRTGRAGKTGMALTLVTPRELRGIDRISRTVGKVTIREVPTGAAIRRAGAAKLKASIEAQQPDSSVDDALEQLLKKHDLEDIARRALSILLLNESREGPEQIGFNQQEIQLLATRGSGGDGERRGKPRGKGGHFHRGGKFGKKKKY